MNPCEPVIPTVTTRLFDGILTVITIFAGAFLGYFFSRIGERGAQRLATYDEATRFLAEYGLLIRKHQEPNGKFLARTVWVDTQVADRFSPIAYEAWRGVETLVTADGRLPGGVSENDYDAKRDLALAAM
jgi:hypothetical protein